MGKLRCTLVSLIMVHCCEGKMYTAFFNNGSLLRLGKVQMCVWFLI